MPTVDQSWATQMEDDDLDDHPVEYDSGLKVVTENRVVDGKKIRVKQYFKTEKRRVSVNVAKRKTWAKYGASQKDPPGPNAKTTFISEEVQMEFLTSREEDNAENDLNNQLNKGLANQNLRCRICQYNHWTVNCPFASQFSQFNKLNLTGDLSESAEDRARRPGAMSLLRDGKRMDSMSSRGKDENNTIRITNLPEETQDGDIRDLFKDFGRIVRIFLAKDKATGHSKGFAFVSFESRDSAAKAIKAVNGHGYNNLILTVEWARPSGN